MSTQNSNTEIVYNRAKLWQIGFFALNNTATNVMYFIMMYVSYYANGIAGIAVMIISTLLTAMRIFDGITDPIIGFFIDKTETKFGKFRPSMVIGYIIMVIAMALLYGTLHIFPAGMRVIGFILIYGLYIIGYTFQTACTKAAQACLTNDPKQRPIFTLFDAIYNSLLFTAVGPVIVVNITEQHGGFSLGFFHHFVPMFVAVSGLFTILAIIGIWQKDRKEFFGVGQDSSNVKFKDYLEVIKKNRAMQMLICAAATDKLAGQVSGNAVVTVILYGIVAGNFALSGEIAATTTIPTIIIVFFGVQFARKFGQKQALIASTWLCILTSLMLGALQLWGPMTSLSMSALNIFTMIYVVIVIAMKSISQISSAIVIPMIADCADYETVRSGKYVPGMMGTLFSFVDKLVSSLSNTIVGFAMVAIGFSEAFPDMYTPYSDTLKFMGVFLFVGLPVIGWICSLIAMKFYPLTPEKMAEIQKEIAEIKNSNAA